MTAKGYLGGGTLGGKLGFVAGLLVFPIMADRALDLICPTFSERGGSNQIAILVAAVLLGIGGSLAVGLCVRILTNRFAHR